MTAVVRELSEHVVALAELEPQGNRPCSDSATAMPKTGRPASAARPQRTITDPTSKTTTRFTDAGGRLIALTNALGQQTRYD